MQKDELLQSLTVDLRRGTLVLAVLSCLNKSKYGYSLLQTMENKGVRIEANTLYPLLRRLESQGLLVSQWDTTEARPRKYYSLSERGRSLYIQLRDEWRQMSHDMENLLNGEDTDE